MTTRTALLTTLALCLGLSASAADKPPLKVVMLSGAFEYQSAKSCAILAKHLEATLGAKCTILQAKKKQGDDVPGMEALDTADLMVVFMRRQSLKGDQLDRFKRYATSGKPIVGVRTASHAVQTWLALDREVLGGNYHGHYGGGPEQTVSAVPAAKDHPVLTGVGQFTSAYSLYKTSPLAADTTLLMTSTTPKAKAPEPAAWVREHKGARIFYTSLGGPEDFKNPPFRRLLVNALFWTARRPVTPKPAE